MAKKKQADENGRREKAKWRGYVNFRPTSSEAAAIREAVLSPSDLDGWLAACVDDGYRVSFKFDDYRGSPVCEVYGAYADSKNPGRTLVVAHSDLLVAASACRWFMDTVAEAGEWPSDDEMSNPYDW